MKPHMSAAPNPSAPQSKALHPVRPMLVAAPNSLRGDQGEKRDPRGADNKRRHQRELDDQARLEKRTWVDYNFSRLLSPGRDQHR